MPTEILFNLIYYILIPVLALVLAMYAIPAFKANTTAKQRENLAFWTSQAILAMEVLYQHNPQWGKMKKEKVIEFLRSKGWNLTEQEFNILIDALVQTLINSGKQAVEPE